MQVSTSYDLMFLFIKVKKYILLVYLFKIYISDSTYSNIEFDL